MKRTERSARYRLLATWRQLLANANHLAVNVDDPDDLADKPPRNWWFKHPQPIPASGRVFRFAS